MLGIDKITGHYQVWDITVPNKVRVRVLRARKVGRILVMLATKSDSHCARQGACIRGRVRFCRKHGRLIRRKADEGRRPVGRTPGKAARDWP